MLDLEYEDEECLKKNMSLDVQNQIKDLLKNNNLYDPCSDETTVDIIRKIIISLCDEKSTLDGPKDIEGYDNLADLDGFDLDDFMIDKQDFDDALEGEMIDQLLSCATIFGENMNPCEEKLVIQHPWAAYQIWLNSFTAENWTKDKFGVNGFGDCSDAFRHTLFNAMNTQSVGANLALEFSEAHECGDTANDSKMDTHNNAVGHQIGINFPDVPTSVLIDRVCDKLEAGILEVLVPDLDGKLSKNSIITSSIECKCK